MSQGPIPHGGLRMQPGPLPPPCWWLPGGAIADGVLSVMNQYDSIYDSTWFNINIYINYIYKLYIYLCLIMSVSWVCKAGFSGCTLVTRGLESRLLRPLDASPKAQSLRKIRCKPKQPFITNLDGISTDHQNFGAVHIWYQKHYYHNY